MWKDSLGYHGNQKGGEFWFNGSEQKDVSACFVLGLCEREGEKGTALQPASIDEFLACLK